MNKLVVLTGAGISAESGLQTFRDSGGLWEGHNVYDVATPEAWQRNPELVQNFYNERRKAVLAAEPNEAHKALVKLEEKFEVSIITQNIDDLHERAGSANIIHLHGLITRSQSNKDPGITYPIKGSEIRMGELCELGSQLRPHVVWFGEPVPMIERAAELCYNADIFIVTGTSLQVYSAAGLINLVPVQTLRYLVDINPPAGLSDNIRVIRERSSTGVGKLVQQLLEIKPD